MKVDEVLKPKVLRKELYLKVQQLKESLVKTNPNLYLQEPPKQIALNQVGEQAVQNSKIQKTPSKKKNLKKVNHSNMEQNPKKKSKFTQA